MKDDAIGGAASFLQRCRRCSFAPHSSREPLPATRSGSGASIVDPMALDQASFRLLPQLSRNLARLGADDPYLDRWKGTYRRAFAFNSTLFHDMASVVQTLSETGIPILVVDGAAIIARMSGESGLRPMGEFGILIPPAEAGRTFATLAALAGARRRASLSVSSPRFAACHSPGQMAAESIFNGISFEKTATRAPTSPCGSRAGRTFGTIRYPRALRRGPTAPRMR